MRVSKKWNVNALLFLKVDNLYVSRIAQEKGLGGMWVYATIIQNFALEVLCLFGPYFVVIAFAKAWWFFNSLNGSELYSTRYQFGDKTLMDSSSPLWVKILFYFAGLLSQSYMQIVYLVPCVYFRMVSSLVLLEMKAYKAMVAAGGYGRGPGRGREGPPHGAAQGGRLVRELERSGDAGRRGGGGVFDGGRKRSGEHPGNHSEEDHDTAHVFVGEQRCQRGWEQQQRAERRHPG